MTQFYFIATPQGTFPVRLPLLVEKDRGLLRWQRYGNLIVILG